MVHQLTCMFSLIVSDYGLFSQDDDPSKGKWLEPARTLDFYPLKSGVSNNLLLLLIILLLDSVLSFISYSACAISRILQYQRHLSWLHWHMCSHLVTSDLYCKMEFYIQVYSAGLDFSGRNLGTNWSLSFQIWSPKYFSQKLEKLKVTNEKNLIVLMTPAVATSSSALYLLMTTRQYFNVDPHVIAMMMHKNECKGTYSRIKSIFPGLVLSVQVIYISIVYLFKSYFVKCRNNFM